MACKCGSNRILRVSGKVSDMCWAKYGDKEHDGYVPDSLNIGSGEFKVCLDCGQMAGNWPVSEETVQESL